MFKVDESKKLNGIEDNSLVDRLYRIYVGQGMNNKDALTRAIDQFVHFGKIQPDPETIELIKVTAFKALRG